MVVRYFNLFAINLVAYHFQIAKLLPTRVDLLQLEIGHVHAATMCFQFQHRLELAVRRLHHAAILLLGDLRLQIGVVPLVRTAAATVRLRHLAFLTHDIAPFYRALKFTLNYSNPNLWLLLHPIANSIRPIS
jgi:hypothetical protein